MAALELFQKLSSESKRSLHLQRTIHCCQKLAVCGTQSTAAVFPEYWQLLWQQESVSSTGNFEGLSVNCLSALCLEFLFLCIYYSFILLYSNYILHFFLKLRNYKISDYYINCLLSSFSFSFLKLPGWTGNHKLWFFSCHETCKIRFVAFMKKKQQQYLN